MEAGWVGGMIGQPNRAVWRIPVCADGRWRPAQKHGETAGFLFMQWRGFGKTIGERFVNKPAKMVAISLRVGDNVSYDSCTYIRNLTG
ncbi:hypothetical protein D9546_07245 [Geobacillus stearothermophilus]|uniref:Uncharacterized protein n=1 Tax=Geobacillus stearothermophilus TaxID=1422 RepID=A0A3L7BAH3_GEOSE|nr:hypothetical protein D9546_07245 [Geobacillus stearothermophilus]RLQ01842.1 hypothetical protein D9545_03300 [Geobacillus stearothermophilus]RLQ09546.1 hypothetical protein D9549_04815 [Geobacillus stearothermophilus]RLQ14683.1 hypothetical protein D9548_04330 [Geobacillus stearothermophilus]